MAKIKLGGELWERVKAAAATAGYSSPEEFVSHVLEKELSALDGAADEEEIKKRLQGLGYIS